MPRQRFRLSAAVIVSRHRVNLIARADSAALLASEFAVIPTAARKLNHMQIERNEIRCFHAVVEAGGFSLSAERLNLSQSAVSQAIANLKHRLGAVLLRRGNPPQLTEAGIRLLRYAETVLNEERARH